MFDKLLQYKKQHCPSEVKPEGNLTLFKLPQLLKQYSPNEVIQSGKSILVKLLQPMYPLIVDYQYYILKTVEK